MRRRGARERRSVGRRSRRQAGQRHGRGGFWICASQSACVVLARCSHRAPFERVRVFSTRSTCGLRTPLRRRPLAISVDRAAQGDERAPAAAASSEQAPLSRPKTRSRHTPARPARRGGGAPVDPLQPPAPPAGQSHLLLKTTMTGSIDDKHSLEGSETASPRPDSHRRRWIRTLAIAAGGLVVLAVGLGVGLGIGLRHHSRDRAMATSVNGTNSTSSADEGRVLAQPSSNFVLKGQAAMAKEPPTTRYYEFLLEERTGSPDGFDKPMLVANGECASDLPPKDSR